MPSPLASIRNTKLGMPGIRPRMPRIAAVSTSTCGLENTWPMTCDPMSPSSPTRDTTRPAATEMISAGSWAWAVADGQQGVVGGRLPSSMLCWSTPTISPPITLMPMIRMPATASPRDELGGTVHRAV